MSERGELMETGGAELCIDEDSGAVFWELWGADWKDSDRMEDGEAMTLCPKTFPEGTRILILEPDYMTDERAKRFYDSQNSL